MENLSNKIFFLIIVISLTACNNHKTNKEVKVNKTIRKELSTSLTPKEIEKQNKTNYELLQGKWQSEEDKTNFLIFENNHRKEIAKGMEKWDDDEFILSDKCRNESNIDTNNVMENDSFISCVKSDFCWYIISLSSETLTLQYMGRGNTLIYKRIN